MFPYIILAIISVVVVAIYLINDGFRSYDQGSKDINSRLDRGDNYDSNMGRLAASHQSSRALARTTYLNNATLEVMAIENLEKAKAKAIYAEIIAKLEQLEQIEARKTAIAILQSTQAAALDASKRGKQLTHLEQIELLLISGDFGRALAEIEALKLRNIEELDRLTKQHTIEFDNYTKLDQYERKRLKEFIDEE